MSGRLLATGGTVLLVDTVVHDAFFDEWHEGDACVSRGMLFFFCFSSDMWVSSLEIILWCHLYLP